MPKTRSGKMTRRVIAAISNFADIEDTTTRRTRGESEVERTSVSGAAWPRRFGTRGSTNAGAWAVYGNRPSWPWTPEARRRLFVQRQKPFTSAC